jgi:hypothetical protein
MPKDDSLKDGTLAVVGAAGAVLAPTPVGAVAVAVAGGLAAIGFDLIGVRDKRRAVRMLEQLLAADESPQELHDQINQRLVDEDEDVISAFRALLVAAVEGVTPAALGAIAVVGRAYLRGECETWIARGWLRIFTEVTDSELKYLRDAVYIVRQFPEPSGFVLADLQDALMTYPNEGRGTAHFATGYGSRIFELLRRYGIGTDYYPGPETKHRPGTIYLPHKVTEVAVKALLTGQEGPFLWMGGPLPHGLQPASATS